MRDSLHNILHILLVLAAFIVNKFVDVLKRTGIFTIPEKAKKIERIFTSTFNFGFNGFDYYKTDFVG